MSEIGKIVTKRDIIRNARDRWMKQYSYYGDDYPVAWGQQKTAGQIRRELASLDLETCSQADLDRAIDAGSSWAANECDLCGDDVENTLRLGDEPDYEARWLDICPECLFKASQILPQPNPIKQEEWRDE